VVQPVFDPFASPAPPRVSIVLPTLNERTTIRDCLASLSAQDAPGLLEILVVDGGSADGTRKIVEHCGDRRVRLVDNPRVTAAAAMNIGVDACRGDVVVRADAHSLYERDYVTNCVRVLEETGAANVGGRMRPVGTSAFGRAVAAVTSSPLGVGPGKFHYVEERTEVDTVYLGCWRRQTLLDLGGYDETDLQWAAEDQELNFRLRRRGGRIILDPAIRSWYFPRDSVRSLWRQYRNYGVAKASTLKKHRTLPTLRPLAPAAFVAASVGLAVFGRRWQRVALPLSHAGVLAWESVRLAEDPGVAPHNAWVAIETCHWGYGIGFWAGVLRILRRQPFEARPVGHR
jgi:glycosyltransferase involved in cell wall biosynthesis